MHFFVSRKSGPLLHGYRAPLASRTENVICSEIIWAGYLFYLLLGKLGKIAQNKWTALIICPSPSLLPFVINPGPYLCILYSPSGGNYRNIK